MGVHDGEKKGTGGQRGGNEKGRGSGEGIWGGIGGGGVRAGGVPPLVLDRRGGGGVWGRGGTMKWVYSLCRQSRISFWKVLWGGGGGAGLQRPRPHEIGGRGVGVRATR